MVVSRDYNQDVMLSVCPKTLSSMHAPRDMRMWVAMVVCAEDIGEKLQLS